MTPAIAGQAGALRAAAAFLEHAGMHGLRVTATAAGLTVEVTRAAGGPAARTGIVARLAAVTGAPAPQRLPGPWEYTIAAAGTIDGHRALIKTVIHDEEEETTA